MRTRHNNLILCGLVGLLASPLSGQSSSKNYVISSIQQSGGDTTSSTNFRMVGSLGSGVVAPQAKSLNFTLVGGFSATWDVKTTGRPWLMGVLPRFATPKSGVTLSLHGTELNLGPVPTITIGGAAAGVVTRQNHLITSKLPFHPGPISKPGPGWQPVTVSNSFGTTTLPRGIGILPMIYTDPAAAQNVGFDIVFKGTQGDQVIWAAAIAPAAPAAIPGFLYGLGLHPATVLLLPGFHILPASGEFRFPIPATSYAGPVYVQALFATTNPGYAPGSFSNVLRF